MELSQAGLQVIIQRMCQEIADPAFPDAKTDYFLAGMAHAIILLLGSDEADLQAFFREIRDTVRTY